MFDFFSEPSQWSTEGTGGAHAPTAHEAHESHGHAPPGSAWSSGVVDWVRDGFDGDRDSPLTQAGRSVTALPAMAAASLWGNLIHESEMLGFLASGGMAYGQGKLTDDERTRNIGGEILTEAQIEERGLDQDISLGQALLQDLGGEPIARSLDPFDDFIETPPAYVDYSWAPDQP